MHWNQRTTLQLAGVTYDAHRADGIRLEIPGTGIWTRIAADRLHPGDEGRGLGQRILNLHERLPAAARRTGRADRAGPPPDRRRTGPARAGRVPTTQPSCSRPGSDATSSAPTSCPSPNRTSTDGAGAAAAGDDPTAPMLDGTAAARSVHPVFGDRQPPTAERFAWVAAYERYNPGVVVWGNRAHGADAWVAAVNAFSLNPANWHPTRRHDIGQFHGVNLHARSTTPPSRSNPATPTPRTAPTRPTPPNPDASTRPACRCGSPPNAASPTPNAPRSAPTSPPRSHQPRQHQPARFER